MDMIYLAVVDTNDNLSYTAFTERDDAESFLQKYMQENIEFYADELPEDSDYNDWNDITDFNESLSVIEVDLDPEN